MLQAQSTKQILFGVVKMLPILGIVVLPGVVDASSEATNNRDIAGSTIEVTSLGSMTATDVGSHEESAGLAPATNPNALPSHFADLDDLYNTGFNDSDDDPELNNFSRWFSQSEIQELEKLLSSLRPAPVIYANDAKFKLFLNNLRIVKVVGDWIENKGLEDKDGYSNCKGDIFELAAFDIWRRFRSRVPNPQNNEEMFVINIVNVAISQGASPELSEVDVSNIEQVPTHALKFLEDNLGTKILKRKLAGKP
ncbi:uncharacterized protein VICG_01728 [Vittaforma corneae ATCC 50505]|uniref:Uncharacterized protein n=1 Tax=Vittaforma corneae (strain ATCC 50505) TaxID=993615 RepID=L2GKT3_VITCO|nr:uncharacterized protein VICG_01728 [Vittaforma corneae ATCC 50505]ELA41239.1 hypothetical protein VICG_01728 [Vittaforma corneae ATCC 50505]